MSTVEERVKKVVGEFLGIKPEEIKLESNLADDLGADSLDFVEVIMALEEEFTIDIPDETAEKLETIQSIVTYVTPQVRAA